MNNPTKTMFFIKANKKNTHYKLWIASLPCIICGEEPSDPHHASIQDGTKGMGTKVPDYYCIPLCHDHHVELHQIGIKTFADKYALNYEVIIIRHLALYIITFGERNGEKEENDKEDESALLF